MRFQEMSEKQLESDKTRSDDYEKIVSLVKQIIIAYEARRFTLLMAFNAFMEANEEVVALSCESERKRDVALVELVAKKLGT